MEACDAIGKFRRRAAREHEMHPGKELRSSKSLHHSELVFMSFAITHTQKVGELQIVAALPGLIRRIKPATNLEDLFCRHARPVDNLLTRKFRDRKDPEGALTGSFHDGCVVQPNQWIAVLRTVNVAEVVDGKDEL